MSAGDQYNAYRNDVIDSYEKERKTEHRGTRLGDAYDDETPGIFNNNILITRMELANGLEYSSSFTYTETGDEEKREEGIFKLFDGYGEYEEGTNTKPKSIRVWSGNDHWLLTKESVLKYIYVIPIGVEVNNKNTFTLIYWNGEFSELNKAISEGTLHQQGHAFLNYVGSDVSPPQPPATDGVESAAKNRSTKPGKRKVGAFSSLLDDYTLEGDSESDKKTENPENIGEGDDPESILDSNATTYLDQSWENLDYVYLKQAPYHTRFSLAGDDRLLPLYGGIYTLVYKDGSTQDINTFSTLSYFISFKELRTYQIPEVSNASDAEDFDWDSYGDEKVRHIPMIVCRPSDRTQRILVRDGQDNELFLSGIIADTYYAELGSCTVFPYDMNEDFTTVSDLNIKELPPTAMVVDISGLIVRYTDPKTQKKTIFSADNGTLYVDPVEIDASEYCPLAGSDDIPKISRVIYAKNDTYTTPMEVMTLQFPIAEFSSSDILKVSGTPTPENESETGETTEISDEAAALALSKAQQSAGNTTEDESTEETSLFRVYSDSKNINFKRLKKGFGKILTKVKKEIDYAQKTNTFPKIISRSDVKSVWGFIQRASRMITDKELEEMPLGGVVSVNTNTVKYLYSPHIVPPVSNATLKHYEENNLGIIPWPMILKAGQFILPFAMRGIQTLVKKIFKKALPKNSVSSKALASGYTKEGIPYVYTTEDTWVESPVMGLQSDAVIMGYDPDQSSTAETLPVRIFSQGQQFNITLHHPQIVSKNGLIGIRQVSLPKTDVIAYGDQLNNKNPEEVDLGKWIGVNSNNEDVPITVSSSKLKGHETYLTVANGGLVCKKIQWSPKVYGGQIDVEVQATTTALETYERMGITLSEHLKRADMDANGLFSGICSMVRKGQKFLENHPRANELFHRGLSWAAGAFYKRASPYINKLVGVNEDGFDSEPPLVVNAPMSITVEDTSTVDSSVDDSIQDDVIAALFDGTFPSSNNLSVDTIQQFFEKSRVAFLFEGDEELDGGVLGSGTHRTYLEFGEFVPSSNLGRDLMEFGKTTLLLHNIEFEVGTSGILTVHTKSDYRLVLTQSPIKTVYSFGEKRMDLTGATWNLVSPSGTVIIEKLTEKNVLCEDLPINIEECQFEEPSSEDQKTKIEVSFMGFKNKEIAVTLLHPYVLAQEEMEIVGEISENTAYALESSMSGFAPVADHSNTRLGTISGNQYQYLTTWPSDHKKLLEALHTKVVLRDNFMRRKVFKVEDMSDSVFHKIYQISNYDPNSTQDIQRITISVLGNTVQRWITLQEIKYGTEEKALEYGDVNPSQLETTPPEDWDNTVPETIITDETGQLDTVGMEVTASPDESNVILQQAHQILLRTKGTGIFRTPNLLARSMYLKGQTGIGSMYSKELASLYLGSTNLRHHNLSNLNGFFKKLWRGIKKGAKWVYQKIVKPVGQAAVSAVTTVAETAMSMVSGGLGNMASGVMGSMEMEMPTVPTQRVFYKPSRLLGANGELLLEPIQMKGSQDATGVLSRIGWTGIKTFEYTDPVTNRKRLANIFAPIRRFSGAFLHRNPVGVPGCGLYAVTRRYPEVYKTGFAGTVTNDVVNGEVFFDALDMIGISTFDENTILYTNASSLSNLDVIDESWCFSAADMNLGETWPTLEEIQQNTYVYVQRSTDLKWIAIPLSHSQIQVVNYSNMEDAFEQFVTVEITIGSYTYTTFVSFYRNASQLKVVKPEDQVFVWTVPHKYFGGNYVAYLAERRHSGSTRSDETSYTDFNYKIADQVKVLSVEGRKIYAIHDYQDAAENILWNDDTETNTITATFSLVANIGIQQVLTYTFYKFTYVTVPEYEITEVKVLDESQNIYVTKDGLKVQYDENIGGMILIGYDEKTTSTTATITPTLKVVDEFNT